MEAILMDVKRAMRSLLGMAHAVSGASKRTGVESFKRAAFGRRPHAASLPLRDQYGREGHCDIHSGRDACELYRIMAFSENPLP